MSELLSLPANPEAAVIDILSSDPEVEECAICLEDLLEKKKETTVLSCSHTYHNACISSLRDEAARGYMAARCPQCRVPLAPEELRINLPYWYLALQKWLFVIALAAVALAFAWLALLCYYY
jgi:hypothetical protein